MKCLHSYRAYGRTSRLALACGAALAATPAAFAQVTDEDRVVVTATATPTEYEKVGSSLTVIDGELIEDQGYSLAADVLRQVPGVAVNRAGNTGALTQVRVRGAEANHTLVLLDGFDISSPYEGEADFSTVLSGDLDRIEVLRGPLSGLYGSNALAGVVNLITRRDVDGAYGEGSLEAGESNSWQVQAGGGLGDGRDYGAIGLHFLSTDGFDTSPDTAGLGVPAVGVGGVRGDKEDYLNTTLYLRGGKELAPGLRVDGIARSVRMETGQDGQAFAPPIGGLAYDDASSTEFDSWFVGGAGSYTAMDGKWVTEARLSFHREERRDTGTFFSNPGFPTATLDPRGADATRSKASLQSTFEFGAPNFLSHLTGFIEAKQETYKNPCEGGPFACSPEQRLKQSRELTGIGLQYRADIAEQVYLSGTLRHDSNGDFQDADTYSLAASWVVPNTGTRPHASVGTGVTNPTFFEQFGFNPGSFNGNSNLVPEEAEGWDIGVEQTLLGGALVVDATYFESTLKKEIFTVFGGPPLFLSTPQNSTSDSDRSGWEATVNWYPTDEFDLIASYTNLDASEPAGIEVRRPENQASLDAVWRPTSQWQFNLGVTHNGEQVDTNFATFLRETQDPYTLVRAGMSYRIDDGLEVYARVENLTDEDYQEVIGFLGAPRAVFVGVRIREGSAKQD